MVVVSMMETSSASGEDASSSAASANVPVVVESSSTSSRSSWPYDSTTTATASTHLHHQPASPSTISSLAASEAAAAAAAIDIDNYFRGSNGFFTPMQNSYPTGKIYLFFGQNINIINHTYNCEKAVNFFALHCMKTDVLYAVTKLSKKFRLFLILRLKISCQKSSSSSVSIGSLILPTFAFNVGI